MKLYSPGNCFCSKGYYWDTLQSARNPGETGNSNETIYGFCTGTNASVVLTPSQSSPLGVDVEGKKVLYRRGTGNEIWTRDSVGTTALLFAAGDIYTYSEYIRDIIYNESTGISSVAFTGLAPFPGGSVASFDNTSGNFIEGPYRGALHAASETGDIYTYYFTFPDTASLFEIKAFKNGSEYATLQLGTEPITHSYSGSIFVIGGELYGFRAPYVLGSIDNPLYRMTKIVSGGNPSDHEDIYLLNSVGRSVVVPSTTGLKGKRPLRGYYNFSTELIDMFLYTREQDPETEDIIISEDLVRFSLDKSRNSTIITNFIEAPSAPDHSSFFFQNG